MSKRYQQTLEGFRPSANPQPESPPSSTDYMLMLKGLIASVQADISAVIDPKHLTADSIQRAKQSLGAKKSTDELAVFDFGYFAKFCSEAGQFYADLQATALESEDTDAFVNFGHKTEIAKTLQDTLLAEGLKLAAAARAASIAPELRRG